MHLLERYALGSSSKISKIDIYEKYYPLPFDSDYIIFAPFSKDSKNYDYYDEILQLIHPILKQNNISIVQIGAKDERPFNYCYHTQGNTSFNQVFNLIRRSKLYLGSDSFGQHVAGAYNIPIVCLIANNYKSVVSSYFGEKTNQIFLEPERNGKKPVFALQEQPKTINTIKPELIVSSIFKLLNFQFTYPYKTLNIGPLYHIRLVENVPDQVVNISNLGGINSLIQRMDILFNENNLFEQLKLCPLSIISDKPINEQILAIHRERIIEVLYKITKDHNPSFIKLLNKHKIKYRLFSDLPAEILNPIKLDYLDFSVIQHVNKDRIDIIKDEDINNGNIYYKSSKILLGRGKIYQSKMDYLNSREIPSFESIPLQVTNNQHLNELWAEKDFLYFLKKV